MANESGLPLFNRRLSADIKSSNGGSMNVSNSMRTVNSAKDVRGIKNRSYKTSYTP